MQFWGWSAVGGGGSASLRCKCSTHTNNNPTTRIFPGSPCPPSLLTRCKHSPTAKPFFTPFQPFFHRPPPPHKKKKRQKQKAFPGKSKDKKTKAKKKQKKSGPGKQKIHPEQHKRTKRQYKTIDFNAVQCRSWPKKKAQGKDKTKLPAAANRAVERSLVPSHHAQLSAQRPRRKGEKDKTTRIKRTKTTTKQRIKRPKKIIPGAKIWA